MAIEMDVHPIEPPVRLDIERRLNEVEAQHAVRILPKSGHDKDLVERTLTKLYNHRPAWLDAAHKALDMAVAQAYGWSDCTATLPDEEILKRLPALNLERAA